jgi:chemotaxis protein CheZ
MSSSTAPAPPAAAPAPAFPCPITQAAMRAEMEPLFDGLQRFLDRRLSELSVEIHGAAQLLGFSEDNLSTQLARLQDQVGRMIGVPGEATRNSGLELEAVVHTTEAAANQILEAAEAINECVRATMPDKSAMAAISAKIDAIFEACAFQDITGQRVRRAIEHLHHMDDALSGLMASPSHEPRPPPAGTVVSNGPDLPQGDIDALFAD